MPSHCHASKWDHRQVQMHSAAFNFYFFERYYLLLFKIGMLQSLWGHWWYEFKKTLGSIPFAEKYLGSLDFFSCWIEGMEYIFWFCLSNHGLRSDGMTLFLQMDRSWNPLLFGLAIGPHKHFPLPYLKSNRDHPNLLVWSLGSMTIIVFRGSKGPSYELHVCKI